MLGFMRICKHVPEACCCLQDGVLAAIALCAADAQELEALGAADLCRGAEAAQQSTDSGSTLTAAVEGVACLSRPCSQLQPFLLVYDCASECSDPAATIFVVLPAF